MTPCSSVSIVNFEHVIAGRALFCFFYLNCSLTKNNQYTSFVVANILIVQVSSDINTKNLPERKYQFTIRNLHYLEFQQSDARTPVWVLKLTTHNQRRTDTMK